MDYAYRKIKKPENLTFDHVYAFCFQDLAVQQECHLQEFMCNTTVCIPRSKVCDLQKDCLNGEDEDSSLCGEMTP